MNAVMKWVFVPCAAVLFVVSLAVSPYCADFHTSANLVCSECHTMHDTDGDGNDSGSLDDYLLVQTGDALCLSCHDELLAQAPYNTNTTPKVKNAATDLAGGDFIYAATDSGSNDGKGHNFGDSMTPAGGSGNVDLHCVSCHDPHGNSNYRILHSEVNSVTGITVTGVEDADWERTSSSTDHNLYKSGMVTFCGACHSDFHGTANTNASSPYVRHPQDKTGIESTAALIGTYSTLVPVEDAAAADPATYTVSAGNSEVFCLSCHRAHASAYDNAGRWDFAAASGTDTKCNICHDK